ncbi:cytochrome P450 6B1-like [Ostrinia furnacalis]|uniref:cytochrome P450 6B1-like n=1 Tax=Ostrinia furnacalis TaxID=93504 RepID=UPI00103F3161|nr:cytochrome P450 6B1-like [Ostrinia furnacalis]
MFGFKRSVAFLVVTLAWALQYYTFRSVLLWYIFAVPLSLAVVYAVGTYDHEYWADRGIFAPPALPFVGHIKTVVTFKEQGGLFFKRIYDQYKDLRFLGTHQFYQRTLVVRDPDLIKRICVNDFQHFVDRGFFFREDVDPLAGSVLFLRGAKWKRLRAKISPIFSPNKLRSMFPLIDNTAKEFLVRVKKQCTKNKHDASNNASEKDKIVAKEETTAEVKFEKFVGGFTADAIVPCAFGLKSNVMDNEDDPFAVALHAFYEMSLFNIFEKTMRQFWPAFVLFFRMRIIPKKTHDFFYNIVCSVLRAREKGDQEKRGDFIDMMMALRNDDTNQNSKPVEEDIEITDMVIAANAFIIFLGGFETTSSTLAFLFLELAAHPEVQDKMRSEIEEVIAKHGQMTYEALQDLTYMEMVILETLRLYPPFPTIQRMCTKDYTIPGTTAVVEEGTIVLFPTLGIHRDEQYFPDAEAFRPTRWAGAAPPPGVYAPFGDGPRYCIGKRFAMIQMKSCLSQVVPRVRVFPVTPRAGPFAADPRSPLTLHPYDSRVRISLIQTDN